jgi:MYXO-CTERM domain-containing protein
LGLSNTGIGAHALAALDGDTFMKASMRFLVVCVCALVVGNAAEAGVIQTVDFNYDEPLGNGTPIVADYGATDEVVVDYRLTDGSYVDLDRLQWYGGAGFGDLTGGAAMDDVADEPLNWGSVTITVKDPSKYRIALNSFLLADRDGFAVDELDVNFKLGVMVYSDNLAPQEWDFRTPGIGLVDEGEHKTVTPLAQLATSITIQWRYPFNIAIDDIRYGLSEVPEPASLVSWVLGLTALGLFGFRRYRRAAS